MYMNVVSSQARGNWILTKEIENLELSMTAAAYFKAQSPYARSIPAASEQVFLGPELIQIKNKVL